jgi:hypothetical protein
MKRVNYVDAYGLPCSNNGSYGRFAAPNIVGFGFSCCRIMLLSIFFFATYNTYFFDKENTLIPQRYQLHSPYPPRYQKTSKMHTKKKNKRRNEKLNTHISDTLTITKDNIRAGKRFFTNNASKKELMHERCHHLIEYL